MTNHGTSNSKEIIGIDLGTTYSCVGVYQNDRVEIIANSMGNRITPSYVAFTENERLIGELAVAQFPNNPENTIYNAKRLIGRNYSDENVQSDKKLWPFRVVQKYGDKPYIEVQYKGEKKQFAPEEISAMVLGKMKEVAENYLGKTVKKAVITVPAYFDDTQRQATKDAGTICGLDVQRIINEPTAAALAYGMQNKNELDEKNILIYDLGGGTFDVSVLYIEATIFEVKATGGDDHLGGEDFNNKLVEFCLDDFKRKNRQVKGDLTKNVRTMRRLRTACERAKRTLSNAKFATIIVDSLYDEHDYQTTVSRARFEEMCGGLFKRTLDHVAKVLQDAKLSESEIERVVLVGGSTRIPKIQELLCKFFNGKQLTKSINPDEAVAYGASMQGYHLSGLQEFRGLISFEILPLSLGLEAPAGFMDVVIPRNTIFPTRKSKTISTDHDNQTQMNINIYEGERARSVNNTLLGQLQLTGIQRAKRGVPQIEVTFTLDLNGILTVEAHDKHTHCNDEIVITNDRGSLTNEEIDRIVKEAENFIQEDQKIKARIESRNALEVHCYAIKIALGNTNQNNTLISGDLKLKLIKASDDCLEWLYNHMDATKEESYQKLKELEIISSPITYLLVFPDTRNAKEKEFNVEEID
ncbi:mediator of RNA polymerase ii transcription subunit 37c-related [Anaeramoeba flamelloides]|uniref:Mediator of RNA polymerase ii transcription subunit 37c-related n=1 Tax=Anaeramoeba flamelloides TaxID=1746091 RepID=A0AAV7Z675_9EUKA|nr:mediator of RNA polymerase ii transcription subunit 37c-related [Anaeramoeba flamelloides]